MQGPSCRLALSAILIVAALSAPASGAAAGREAQAAAAHDAAGGRAPVQGKRSGRAGAASRPATDGTVGPGDGAGSRPSEIEFGDDASPFAGDGECDDPRFEGPGMTQTPLLDRDIGHDASDCRAAFAAGTIALRGEAASPIPVPSVPVAAPRHPRAGTHRF